MDRDQTPTIPEPELASGPAHAEADVDADVEAELTSFEAELALHRRGEIPEDRFRALRLIYGVYGQRQAGVHMVRLKLPAGRVTDRELLAIADASERYGNGVAHLTTRQDVQLYDVPLESVPALLRHLHAAGITTREACFNSVRNVTACPLSGLLADEAFAVQPYALATARYLLRRPASQQLARKFKIAFSGCPEDCTVTAIHDLGFRARVETRDGRPRPGFQVLVGGGLGATPQLAQTLSDFVALEELLPTVAAVLRVYAAHGNRRNKNRARLKFVVAKLGLDAFRARVAEARASLSMAELADAELLRHVPIEAAPVVRDHLAGALPEPRPPQPSPAPDAATPDGEAPYSAWRRASVRRHLSPERALVTLAVPLGDLAATALRQLAALVARYSAGEARLAVDQNLVLPHVRGRDLPSLYGDLVELGLAGATVGTALDVVSCPGADTCNLGITSSKGLARAIREELGALAELAGAPLLRDLTIKISGCPNSCSQHHVAAIGLHGASARVGDRQLPVYQLLLGGRADGAGARIGRRSLRVPARRVPQAIAALLRAFAEQRQPDETFTAFAARLPEKALDELLRPYALIDALGGDATLDWGQSTPFGTESLGAAKHASGPPVLATELLEPARAEVAQAGRFLERGLQVDALATLGRAQYTLARALLEVLGKRPESDDEATGELLAHVIDRGLLSDAWDTLRRETDEALRYRRVSRESIEDLHRRALGLLDEADGALPDIAAHRASARAAPP